MIAWELRCLQCSRHLADAVIGDNGRSQLNPPAGHATILNSVVCQGRKLLCRRCGGRVMAEPIVNEGAVMPKRHRLTSAA